MIREPGKLIDESKSTDPLQFLILTDQAAKTPLLTIFHMINSFSLRGHPFWPVKKFGQLCFGQLFYANEVRDQ